MQVCNHRFHNDCLQRWGDTSCPVVPLLRRGPHRRLALLHLRHITGDSQLRAHGGAALSSTSHFFSMQQMLQCTYLEHCLLSPGEQAVMHGDKCCQLWLCSQITECTADAEGSCAGCRICGCASSAGMWGAAGTGRGTRRSTARRAGHCYALELEAQRVWDYSR